MSNDIRRLWQRAIRFLGLLLLLGWVALSSAWAASDPVLKPGCRGEQVSLLQLRLRALGYGIEADGVYGKATEAVVRHFQVDYDLQIDGVVGPSSWEVLRALTECTTYTVQPGDTLWEIAAAHDISVDDLRELNGLRGDRILPGQKLVIVQRVAGGGEEPAQVFYRVKRGDNLATVARRYGTSVEAIAAANSLRDPNCVYPGQVLLIPGSYGSRTGIEPSGITWPVRGRISSPYGWRIHPVTGERDFHGGIDIAVNIGTPVRAAASGIVEEAGDMGFFGLGVKLRHSAAVTTFYGHLSRVAVRAGQWVKEGAVIGYSGDSGRSTGPHLDFRIKIEGTPVDPLIFLP